MATDSTCDDLYRQALDAALNCDWEKALEINLKLSKLLPGNTECLNRLAKSYFELGKYALAKKIYSQVLEIDPYNTIAQKNIKKISSFKKNANGLNHNGGGNGLLKASLSPSLFLEEPGVTKIVNLVKVAEPQKLLTLSPGSIVNLIAKKRGISIVDSYNQYLGALPDDSAHHLQKLITGGNKYQVIIKSVKNNGLSILIREVFRSKKFKNQASFLDESRVLAYSSDNISLMKEMPEDDTGEEAGESVV